MTSDSNLIESLQYVTAVIVAPRFRLVEASSGSRFHGGHTSECNSTRPSSRGTVALDKMTNDCYRLFIDDLRDPVSSSWVIARTSAEAVAMLEARGCPSEISFDHDLGGDDTAMTVVKRLIELDLDAEGRFIPEKFIFSVHSANPVGRNNIVGLLRSYLQHRARPPGEL